MRIRTIIFVFSITTLMNSCMNHKKKADLLVLNGRVYTTDSLFTVAEAMAVTDGRITETGTNAGILGRYRAKDTLDLEGLPVYPGFIDAHCHFLGYARNLQFADLTGAGSFDEVIGRLREFRTHFKGEWLAGRGWDQNLWVEKKFPDRQRLDIEFPDIPVMLIRIDGHVVLANGEALRRAGIGPVHAFDPAEVEIRDGRLTGILREQAADHMRSVDPEPDTDVMEGLIHIAAEECHASGLTALSDAGLDIGQVFLLDSLQRAGKLKMRIHVMLSPDNQTLDHFLSKGPYRTDRMNVCAIKVYADGSLGGRTALLKRTYTDDPGNRGIAVTSSDSLLSVCTLALKHGFQVCTHAIGDSANRMVLETYGRVLQGKNDHRWRIEHAQVVDPADIHLFGDFSIIPSVQATHATSDMYWAEERLGSQRMKGAYVYHSLMQQNGWIPNGTDFPIEKINPLYTFYAAVVRKDLKGYPSSGFYPEEALTREEALRSMTIWAAKACFLERETGSLEAGKKADFVILESDLMTEPPEAIPNIRVKATFVDGVAVFVR